VDETTKADDPATAFPASENTPGQAESRSAYESFAAELSAQGTKCAWRDDYLQLRSEGWDWRKAAYIAWSSSPAYDRWPPTQAELATQVLGLKSARTIQKWRENDKHIDERVAEAQIEPLLKHRRDVIDALVTVASSTDTAAHSDRKLFFEMIGDYRPRSEMSLTGKNGGPVQTLNVGDVAKMTDDELDLFIDNLQAIAGAISRGADGEDATPEDEADGSAAPAVDDVPAEDANSGSTV